MEAYHRYKVQSAFTEYYENEPIGILPYIEDESFLPKRKLKRKRKRKNIKRRVKLKRKNDNWKSIKKCVERRGINKA
jgi:hypothetical protein